MQCIATSWENREAVLALAREYEPICASVGIHPLARPDWIILEALAI